MLLVENKNTNLNLNPKSSYILIDYKNIQLDNLDDFELSKELIKEIKFDEEIILNNVYINKLNVKIISQDELLWEADIENILSNFIKIIIE